MAMIVVIMMKRMIIIILTLMMFKADIDRYMLYILKLRT
jgi:hypothetical protein